MFIVTKHSYNIRRKKERKEKPLQKGTVYVNMNAAKARFNR